MEWGYKKLKRKALLHLQKYFTLVAGCPIIDKGLILYSVIILNALIQYSCSLKVIGKFSIIFISRKLTSKVFWCSCASLTIKNDEKIKSVSYFLFKKLLTSLIGWIFVMIEYTLQYEDPIGYIGFTFQFGQILCCQIRFETLISD